VTGNHGYGTFNIDTAGVWTYDMNSAHDEFAAGTDYTDSITVAAADGTTQVITVTIHGTADGPLAAPAVDNGTDDPNNNDSAGPGAAATLVMPLSGGPNDSAHINGDNTIVGTNGADSIDAAGGTDVVYGYGGNDTLIGGSGTDSVYGGAGNDSIQGNAQTDVIYGGTGNDTISGGADTDSIYGGSGNDSITGDAGTDVIVGGYGADTLTGNAGSDTFAFLSTRDTGDTITDFVVSTSTNPDKIDLSVIDANTVNAGNQAFGWGGQTTTLAANSVIWFVDGGNTYVQADTDGNIGTAEFEVELTGTPALTAADFIL
jgi:VCBS repeat-containing protein